MNCGGLVPAGNTALFLKESSELAKPRLGGARLAEVRFVSDGVREVGDDAGQRADNCIGCGARRF